MVVFCTKIISYIYLLMNILSRFVKKGFIKINKDEMSKLKQKYTNDKLLYNFGKLKLKFPYKIYYIFHELSPQKRLSMGKQYEPIFDNTRHKNLDITTKHKTNEYTIKYSLVNLSLYDYNVISDAYTEKCRVKATIKDKKSVYEYFKNKKLHSQWLNFNNIEELDTKILRDMLYYNLKRIEPTNFPSVVAIAVYKLFNAKKILDMSSGWGDRLLAAIVHDERYNIEYYYGVDPNKCLFDGYKSIIKLSRNPQKFVLINDVFENVKIDAKFDLMFSSPPYFDFEKYTTEDSQSYIQYKSVDDWLNKFMYVSIQKIYSLLEINGYMCINISDIGNIPYVYNILQYAKKINGFIYLGAIGFKKSEKIHRPIYIFKKIK